MPELRDPVRLIIVAIIAITATVIANAAMGRLTDPVAKRFG